MTMDAERLGAAIVAEIGNVVELSAGQVAALTTSMTALAAATIAEIETYFEVDGGVTDHAALSSNLSWTSSGHTGTASRIAGFDGSGLAALYTIGSSGGVQAWDADLDAIAALAKTDGNFIVGNGSAWVVESGATARTSLGLGSIATQAANSVAITGGSISGITDLAVADGGTGASTAAAARANLGIAGYIYDRTDDINAGEQMISNFAASGFAGSSMGGWRVQIKREGQTVPFYAFDVTRYQSSWNASNLYSCTGVKRNASNVTTAESGVISSSIGTADVTLYDDGVLRLAITGTSNGAGAHKLIVENKSGNGFWMDGFILHLAEMAAN